MRRANVSYKQIGDGLWATFDPDLVVGDPCSVEVRPMFQLFPMDGEFQCHAYRFKPTDLDDPEATVR